MTITEELMTAEEANDPATLVPFAEPVLTAYAAATGPVVALADAAETYSVEVRSRISVTRFARYDFAGAVATISSSADSHNRILWPSPWGNGCHLVDAIVLDAALAHLSGGKARVEMQRLARMASGGVTSTLPSERLAAALTKTAGAYHFPRWTAEAPDPMTAAQADNPHTLAPLGQALADAHATAATALGDLAAAATAYAAELDARAEHLDPTPDAGTVEIGGIVWPYSRGRRSDFRSAVVLEACLASIATTPNPLVYLRTYQHAQMGGHGDPLPSVLLAAAVAAA